MANQPCSLRLVLLPGTSGGLQHAIVRDSFHWMPSSSNFEGIDSVLGALDGQVYILQKTIGGEVFRDVVWLHAMPPPCIVQVWGCVLKQSRFFKWSISFTPEAFEPRALKETLANTSGRCIRGVVPDQATDSCGFTALGLPIENIRRSTAFFDVAVICTDNMFCTQRP